MLGHRLTIKSVRLWQLPLANIWQLISLFLHWNYAVYAQAAQSDRTGIFSSAVARIQTLHQQKWVLHDGNLIWKQYPAPIRKLASGQWYADCLKTILGLWQKSAGMLPNLDGMGSGHRHHFLLHVVQVKKPTAMRELHGSLSGFVYLHDVQKM